MIESSHTGRAGLPVKLGEALNQQRLRPEPGATSLRQGSGEPRRSNATAGGPASTK